MLRVLMPTMMSALILINACPAALADDNGVNFKIYSPSNNSAQNTGSDETTEQKSTSSDAVSSKDEASQAEVSQPKPSKKAKSKKEAKREAKEEKEAKADNTKNQEQDTKSADATTGDTNSATADGKQIASRVLQGYIRVVPSGTKIPIIMDTAVDTDTSQEGDEFSARTAEDLCIDGTNVLPAGSIIKGRIAQLNAPRALNRSGSVALKFDTVTTPDNREIPIVATLVARGGVVHAKRGVKDYAIDTGIVTLPTVAGLGIGLVAGNKSDSKIGSGGGAVIGASVGVAVGMAILLSKKGKKVDVRPGDEMKIELSEDLRMPMM